MVKIRDEGYDLELAVGVQLDILGKYIGIDRVITGTAFTREYFGYAVYGDYDFDFHGYMRYGEVVPDVQMRRYEESNQSLYTLTDAEYRIMLKLGIVRNSSNASVKQIDDILDDLFGSEVYFTDRQNMTVVSYLIGEKYRRIFEIAKSSNLLPNPAGVGVVTSVVPDIDHIFAFGIYGSSPPSFSVGYIMYAFSANGALSLWKMDDNDPVLHDYLGNNDGTIWGDIGIENVFGYDSIYRDGSELYIVFNTMTLITGPVSITSRIRTNGSDPVGSVIGQWSNDDPNISVYYFGYEDETGVFVFKISDGSTIYKVYLIGSISESSFDHVCGIFNPGESLQIYLNGELNNENTINIPESMNDSTYLSVVMFETDEGHTTDSNIHIAVTETIESSLSSNDVSRLYNDGNGVDRNIVGGWAQYGET
jgi:hypothetical protein